MVSWWGFVIFDGQVQMGRCNYVLVQLLVWGTNFRCTVARNPTGPEEMKVRDMNRLNRKNNALWTWKFKANRLSPVKVLRPDFPQ